MVRMSHAWTDSPFEPEYRDEQHGAVARLHAAVMGNAPRLFFYHLVSQATAEALLAEIQSRCPDCRKCEECSATFCQKHGYGNPSECNHHDVCSECWPAHCKECRQLAEADPDFTRQAHLESTRGQ